MNILVSGCSFTANQTWPSLLLAPKSCKILNLGQSAAGNEYISNSVVYNVDKDIDFVFVLASGINRTELRVPNDEIFKDASQQYPSVVLGDSKYFLSGHAVDPQRGWLAGYNLIKSPEWPDITCLQDWFDLSENIKRDCLEHKIYLSSHGGKENSAAFCHQYFITQHLNSSRQYLSEKTFQNLANCFNMLEKLKIPYRFSFIYDIWSEYSNHSLGTAVKNKYYSLIDWSKFIDLPPLEYGLKNNLMMSDDFHLTRNGMNQWAGEITKILRADKELQHLFN